MDLWIIILLFLSWAKGDGNLIDDPSVGPLRLVWEVIIPYKQTQYYKSGLKRRVVL